MSRLALALLFAAAITVGASGCGDTTSTKTEKTVEGPGGTTKMTEEKTTEKTGENPPPANP